MVVIGSSRNIIFSNRIVNSNCSRLYMENSVDNTIYNNYLLGYVNVETRNVLSNAWSVELGRGVNIAGGQWIGGNAYLRPDGKGYSQVSEDVLEPTGVCDEPYYIAKDNIDIYPLGIKPRPEPALTPVPTLTLTPTPIPTPTPIGPTPTPSQSPAQMVTTLTTRTDALVAPYVGISVKLGDTDYVLVNATFSAAVVV